ncbi:MAG: methyltransferase domain-containing protein, partial [Mycobacterium sp.]|nr:methyltransferase domain-containing protein [Mycobacterium sp.]
MASDRLNALYRAQIWEESTQQICRERIHWICSQVQGEDVLDLGCSEGMASLLLGQEGHQVVGVDINPAAVEVARQELTSLPDFVRQNVRFELISAGRLPFDDASFDTVLMGEVLEHQTRPERLLAEARRVLRPGGVAVVTTPFGVLRDEDHKQTFYLSDFVELITRFFHTEHLHTLGKYICYVGSVARVSGVSENGVVEPLRLLRLSEETFHRAENTYLERLDRTRGELNTLKQKLTHLHATADAERKERSALAAKLMVAQRWYNRSLQFMSELRTLLNRNGKLGDLSQLTARTERILSTANGQVDAAHALDMLAEVVRDLVGGLESQLVTRERELVRMREAQQVELARLQQLRQEEVDRVRRELQTTVEQQRSAAERRVHEVRKKEVGAVQRALKQKEAQLAQFERNTTYLRKRLSRHRELLNYFKAELVLKRQEVRYRLGDAFVGALKHPRDLVLLPIRLARLFFEGLHRTFQRRRHSAEPPPAEMAPAPVAVPVATTPPAPPAVKVKSKPAAPRPVVSAPEPAVAPAPHPPSEPALAAPLAEPKFRFQPVVAPDRPPHLPVTLATIMDEFTAACFKPEARLLAVTPDNWRSVLEQERPNALFVESAWQGNAGAWASQLTRAQHIPNGPLLALVDWCKSNHIPTVFWNKEDPPNFEHFIHAAKHFEHIFTTDEDCIPRYRAQVPHTHVYALPFAAQPAVHNPVGSRAPRYGRLCFAGTYYNKRHADRRKDVELLLGPALTRGLSIFDRMADYTKSDNYHFPPEYRPAICGALPYAEMLDAYKRFDVFLNVNSVTESPTMFSRRVFELLACGTPVISTYALGIERLLGADM